MGLWTPNQSTDEGASQALHSVHHAKPSALQEGPQVLMFLLDPKLALPGENVDSIVRKCD
jgi:hypothetical protein